MDGENEEYVLNARDIRGPHTKNLATVKVQLVFKVISGEVHLKIR